MRNMISSGKDLKLALDSSGKSQAGLARWLGLDPSIVSKMVSGAREIKARELIKIKEFLGLDDEETGSERSFPHPRFSDKIPIIGGAYGGAHDTVFFNRNTIQGYRPRPPLLDGVLDAFAVYVVGESMVPKFEPGALVYIDPNLPPAPFKYVVIDVGNNRAVIKQYLRLESNTFIVRQFKPAQDTPIPLGDVVRIYRIIMSEEP